MDEVTTLKSQRRAGRGRRLLGGALGYFVMGISVVIAQPSNPPVDERQNLFVNTLEWEGARASAEPSVVRTRSVRVTLDHLAPPELRSGDKLRLNLFDDVSFVAILERSEVRSPGSYTWFGRLADEEYSSFILVVEQGVMAASIRVPGKGVYQVGYFGKGVHVIREIDESKLPPCGVGDSEGMVAHGTAVPCGGPDNGCVDDGSQIDVLVVYTQAARNVWGGTAAINASIQLAVGIANNVYVTSLINTRLNLVLAAEIDYDESSGPGFGAILNFLKNPNDGVMDEVHALRNAFRADLVSLIVDGLSGGIGELAILIQPFDTFGFSVVSASSLAGSTFTHELGHNMGCAHNRGATAGFFDYSFGHRFIGDSGRQWHTIMSGTPGIGIQSFSNPEKLFDGQPTGVAAGNPDSADNARTIDETALIIANIRPSVPPDCNGNGIGDDEDIANGTSDDQNNNGVPDECDIILHVDAGAPPGGDGMSWATAYNDLQDALLDAACPCRPVTEIWVAAGTYTPDRGTGDREARFHTLNVAIYGGFAGNEVTFAERAGLFEQTILSGDLNGDDGPDFQNNDENSYTVVFGIRTFAGAVLDGFTITAGNADSDVSISSLNSGGGVIVASGSLKLRHCHIIGNTAKKGAGITVLGGGTAVTLVNCTISKNKAINESPTPSIGGGLLSSQTLRLINCEVTNNSADRGGGLYFGGGTILLDNCVISGNTSEAGGGIFSGESESTVINSTFSMNSGSFAGGGVVLAAASTLTVINSTFSMNSALIQGGGVYLTSESTLTLRNSIFWNNTDTDGTRSNETAQIFDEPLFGVNVVSVEYSCVQDDDPDDASVYPGTGNIDDDPLFVDAEGSDLHLLPGSPCVDAGDNFAVTATTDLDGNFRRRNDPDVPDTGNGTPPIVDMGAYERPGEGPLIPTISEWGLSVMTLLILTAGTLVLARIPRKMAHGKLAKEAVR